MRVGRDRVSVTSRRLWRLAVLAAAGTIGAASHAEAAIFWPDSDSGFSRPGAAVPQRRQISHRRQVKKIAVPEKQSAKPQGPLIISISIEKQNLRIYDANGFFAETPVSTGMPGHATPMGVFSVLEKQKMHHSNIYSGAPMPFMQRITWSGVAIHAGVLPGRPASHGCIRMPMAFAVKMYGWTRSGARVVITPGEMSPASFSHPLLPGQKVVPRPVVANETKTDVQQTRLELRSTVAHDDTVRPAEPAASMPLREQTHTADASSNLPAMKAPMTMSDATPGAVSIKTDDASTDAKPEAVKPEAATPEAEQIAKRDGATPTDEKPVEIKSSEAAVPDLRPVEADASGRADTKSDDTSISTQASADAAGIETPASENVKAEETNVEAKVDEVKTDASIADTPNSETPKPEVAKEVAKSEIKSDMPPSDLPKSAEKSDDSVKSVAETGALPDVKKDQIRLPDPEKATVAKPASPTLSAPKRSGQIAVFISRKDGKLYVRQNFAPLFDAPVTVAADERPLGTHIFTAQADKDDANVLHWSVVSLPAPRRNAERRDEDERTSRRRKMTGVVERKPMPVQDSPAEALDRLTIPADAMARITDLLSTGGSIIVSDQGITAGETGEGTDFIVSLR